MTYIESRMRLGASRNASILLKKAMIGKMIKQQFPLPLKSAKIKNNLHSMLPLKR